MCGHFEVHILAGDANIGAGGWPSPHIIMHEEFARRLLESGTYEELLLHELTHATFTDGIPGYFCAAKQDNVCISPYARDNTVHEDTAESMTAWIAATIKKDRVSEADRRKINQAIPNRLSFFNNQGCNLSPLTDDALHPANSNGYKMSSSGPSAPVLCLPITYEKTKEDWIDKKKL